MWKVFLDATTDSLKLFGSIFLIYILISIIESKVSKKIHLKSKLSPLFGGMLGVIPQCGFSVVATDLYIKRHITIGTLFAVYIACSDEAIPILLSNPASAKIILPLLILKIIFSFIVGFIIDLIFYKNNRKIQLHYNECHHEEEIHKGCCEHNIEGNSKIRNYLLHPLIHSLKIFVYLYIVNLCFEYAIYFIGEKNIYSFFNESYIFLPIVSSVIGLIPNCASSVIITELLVNGVLPFGAAFAGLCCNAGLGIIYLLKNNKNKKESLFIVLTLFIVSLIVGYIVLLFQCIFNI